MPDPGRRRARSILLPISSFLLHPSLAAVAFSEGGRPLNGLPNDRFTSAATRARHLVGLFLALFGMLIVRQLVNYVWPDPTFASALMKEGGMWLVAVLLLVIIRVGERLPFSSIGLGTARWGKSVLWGFLLGLGCLLVAVGLVALTGYTGGEAGKAFDKLPTWLLFLIVLRAGVVEELCYRGYAIERLHALGLPRWVAASVPLLIFGVGHWTGGWANIAIALVLGGMLALFFIWRRDLVANMIGHWFVDFIGNVLPRLLP